VLLLLLLLLLPVDKQMRRVSNQHAGHSRTAYAQLLSARIVE